MYFAVFGIKLGYLVLVTFNSNTNSRYDGSDVRLIINNEDLVPFKMKFGHVCNVLPNLREHFHANTKVSCPIFGSSIKFNPSNTSTLDSEESETVDTIKLIDLALIFASGGLTYAPTNSLCVSWMEVFHSGSHNFQSTVHNVDSS